MKKALIIMLVLVFLLAGCGKPQPSKYEVLLGQYEELAKSYDTLRQENVALQQKVAKAVDCEKSYAALSEQYAQLQQENYTNQVGRQYLDAQYKILRSNYENVLLRIGTDTIDKDDALKAMSDQYTDMVKRVVNYDRLWATIQQVTDKKCADINNALNANEEKAFYKGWVVWIKKHVQPLAPEGKVLIK